MITVYENGEALGEAVAGLFLHKARLAVAERGRFIIALAGGQTPQGIYEMLAKPPYVQQVPWSKVHVFWGDERYVPANDLRSNQLMARKAFLDIVPIPEAQIHPVLCTTSPGQAALAYEAVLASVLPKEEPKLDFTFLGVGADGHTASLFPNTSVLHERERWTGQVYLPELDSYRVTFTVPFINQSRTIAFVVTGENKAEIMHEVLEGPSSYLRLPAQMIHPQQGELHWFLDQEASRLLQVK